MSAARTVGTVIVLSTLVVVPPAVSRAAAVPPGGLLTSFVGNQVTYCSLICPLLVQTGTTAIETTLGAPGVFISAVGSGELLKAIGSTAASITGPTSAAWSAAVTADGTLVAPRALNAFETGVVGVLGIVPAAANGPAAVVGAIQDARRETFAALNAPIVANPTPTVDPHGIVEVAAVGAMNVVGAVIFPAFNDALYAAGEVPDAVARELASSGDPLLAGAAGAKVLRGRATQAVNVVNEAAVTALKNIRAELQPSPTSSPTPTSTTPTSTTPTSTTPTSTTPTFPRASVFVRNTPRNFVQQRPLAQRPLRDTVKKVQPVARDGLKKLSHAG